MEYAIQYGTETIKFSLHYSQRKTLGITVTPYMDVIVKAPFSADQEKIYGIVKKRARWILKQKRYFLAFFPKQIPKRFVSGESHLYLGRHYRLKIVKTRLRSVKFDGAYLVISCRSKIEARNILTEWYHERALLRFESIVKKQLKRFKQFDLMKPDIVIRDMIRRWGSCTLKRRIILNPELIKAPLQCIEYVVIHELCHLVHKKHDVRFFELQSKMMPQWKKWKMKLEKLLA